MALIALTASWTAVHAPEVVAHDGVDYSQVGGLSEEETESFTEHQSLRDRYMDVSVVVAGATFLFAGFWFIRKSLKDR